MTIKKEFHKKRVKDIQNKLREICLHGAIINSKDNIFYFSGYRVFEEVNDAVIFIPAEGEPSLIFHEDETNLESITQFQGKKYPYKNKTAISDILKDETSGKAYDLKLGAEKYFIKSFIAESVSISGEKGFEDITGYIEEIRSVKYENEIELIKKAVSISLIGQKKATEIFFSGIDEITLQSHCKQAMEESAGIPIEVKSDVLFGKKTALVGGPDGIAGRNMAKKSDNAIIDLLPRVKGYYGDLTRTLYLEGISKYKIQVITFLEDTKKELEKKLKPGITCEELDYVARSRLSREGSFPHHTGHGIGIASFEFPYIIPDSKSVLKEGMTITLEPGIYFKDWGARIEDDYLIVKNGYEKLSGE